MAPPRFGASKYRNSLLYIPPREEFYRSNLPSNTQNTSSSTSISTFSSEIKSNREWIVTVTANGDLSYRGYGASEGQIGIEKVGKGGGVGDWDLSGLEDGSISVGNLDGSISVYSLPEFSSLPSPITLRATIPPISSSPITNISLHPTTPDVLLVSSVSHPLVIYDFSSESVSPAITLKIKEPKGIWYFAWSSDGKKIAVIGKSGNLSVFEPRSSLDPIKTKNYSFSIQALKPCRIAWIGEDIFLTSFSKSRTRQYSLISTTKNPESLETIFTESIDTSPGVLIPLIDEERKLIYLIGKGDMILRQIELTPSTGSGFQETLHHLPFPLSSNSICLKNQTKLDVMNAEISRILIPIIDKDGEAILPLGIRIPRRQLIDYHDDLYPDIIGSVPEQSAEEWFEGEDKKPLYITLDPARRNTWEGKIEEYKQKFSRSNNAQSASSSQPFATLKPTNTLEAVAPVAKNDQAKPLEPTPSAVSPEQSQQPAQPATPTSSDNTTNSPAVNVNPKLPPLEKDETYSSTTYKSRIVADYLAVEYERHQTAGNTGPLFAGLQGPQGCGKTTLCSGFVEYLKEKKGLTAAVLSLDDLYKTHDGLTAIAQKHQDNALLAGRGPPGTHDTELAISVLAKVKEMNKSPNDSVDLPIFDKSLCGGEGDRSPETLKITGPIDVFILEGWSMGFAPLSPTDLEKAYSNPKPASVQTSNIYYIKHPISSLQTLNTYLEEFSKAIYPNFKAFIQVEPLSYDYVFKWRLQQEHMMKDKNGGKGMNDEQVQKFVERYMPGYELWKEGIWNNGTGWEGRGLKLVFGGEREILDVVQPTSEGTESDKDHTAPTPKEEVKAEVEEDVNGQVKEEEKGDIQLKEVEIVAKEKEIKSVEQDLGAKVDIPKESEVTPFPPPSKTTAKAQPEITPVTPADQSNTYAPWPAASLKPQERFNPQWSRKFLAGKSPLIPSYDSIPALSSLHQDSKILKANAHLAFFPIQGTGGRLNVHPLSKKGRFSVGGEGYLSGGVEIVDFDVEVAGDRVAVAGEDGVIRVWKVGKEGIQGVGPGPDLVLKGKGIDKITQIAFHPTAKDLLVGLTNDHGSAYIRFWNLPNEEEVNVAELPAKGAFNFVSSPLGNQIAIATKDNRILVLDPRKSSRVISGKAHDGPRSFQITWIDDRHLISVGFSKGSQRKINLYKIPHNISEEIEIIYSMTIDVSPSVLFPIFDPDTSILYIWGKGERVIQTYEIHLDGKSTELISKLPSYTAGSPQIGLVFLPKRMVDVRKVEIGKCLRLTARTMEEVTFTIPRNKPEFFQDDIYVPTADLETYWLSGSDWLKGSNVTPRRLDLKPEGMIPLSQAPKSESTRKKFVPAADIMTEEEKKKQEMDALFAKAKLDESSDEEEEVKGLAAPDDDW